MAQLIHREIPHWICVECGAITIPAKDADYPAVCRCGGTDFIRDTLAAKYSE